MNFNNNEPYYQIGSLVVANQIPSTDLDCAFGIQINWDGRIWVCHNSVTFLTFKPNGKDVESWLAEHVTT